MKNNCTHYVYMNNQWTMYNLFYKDLDVIRNCTGHVSAESPGTQFGSYHTGFHEMCKMLYGFYNTASLLYIATGI